MKENLITQESFDILLGWLDHNREIAGQKYEKIRRRLIRVFAGRGCFEAEELADETINRVILKLPKIRENYIGEPAFYFYNVADKIHLEWLRRQTRTKNVELTENTSRGELQPDSEEYGCLKKCLRELPENQSSLIVDYYQKEKTEKIQHHKKMAESLGISANALQVKSCRIRARLQRCVRECLEKKNK